MKILFLTPSVRLLGARQSLLALVTHLPPGVRTRVVCPGGGGLAEELQKADIAVDTVPHGAWRKLGGRLQSHLFQLPALRKIVRDFDPDIIHCNEFHSTPQGIRSASGARGKVGVTSHVRLGITPRQIRNYELAGCQRIAAVSQACRSLFDGSGLSERVDVIYNGVDVSALPGHGGAASLRADFGWPEDDLVLALLGLVSPRKNQLLAAEALAEANRRGARAKLLLAGDAFKSTQEYGDRLRRRIEQDDLGDHVRWLPFQKQIAPLYATADVNLLISSEEGFGRTIIEAGAMEKPSIGTRTGGIPELIIEGKTGWLVDEGSVSQLADAIVAAAQERQKLNEYGGAARRRVMEQFTIEAHARKMMEFWERGLSAAEAQRH